MVTYRNVDRVSSPPQVSLLELMAEAEEEERRQREEQENRLAVRRTLSEEARRER